MLLTEDEGVKSFIANLTAQISEWFEPGKLQRVVLVIMSKATSEVLERWNFNIETDGEVVEKDSSRTGYSTSVIKMDTFVIKIFLERFEEVLGTLVEVERATPLVS
ncbi:hypothetical protein V8G54_001080 [Vigna mungo]|uniref:HORMA domain-containing protein n=1 Tax=Vigna mungo TaxID=3915 RepID=A0AAQ3P7M8_VIGMU